MNKRFEIRRAIDMPMELFSSLWNKWVDFKMVDLTPRGAFVTSEIIPDIGDKLACAFYFPGTPKSYSFFGEVTRANMLRRKTDTGWPGFGVSFLDCTPMERLHIRHALRGLPPPIPGRLRNKGRAAGLEWVGLPWFFPEKSVPFH